MRWFTVIAILGIYAAVNRIKKELVSETKRNVSCGSDD